MEQLILKRCTRQNNIKKTNSLLNESMKVSKYFLLISVALPLVLTACRGQLSDKPPIHLNQNMDDQQRYNPQQTNEFFDDNRAMRQPVEGTISRGNLKHDKPLYQGINEDSSFVDEIPVDVSKSFLYRGKEQYEIYCTPCHGIAGDGEGIVMTGGYGYVPAPSFHQERLRNRADGYFYSTITNGIRNMPSYAHQISVEDRWAIVSYVRALQRSQNVPEQEMQKYEVDITALQESYTEKQTAAEERQKKAKAAAGDEEISAERGRTVAEDNGCMTCHSTDGSKMTAPTWKGVYGHEVELQDGSTVTADEEYLTESIIAPQEKVVQGFQPVMASYDYLSDAKVQSLVEYIKSLSDAEADENASGDSEADQQQMPQQPTRQTPGPQSADAVKSVEPPQNNSQSSVEKEQTSSKADTLTASAKEGKKLIQTFKCLSCHTIKRQKQKDFAPPFQGLYESDRKLADGSTVVADDGYIIESIQYPGAKLALGYNHNMPSYRDLFSDDELESIVDYFKALQ